MTYDQQFNKMLANTAAMNKIRNQILRKCLKLDKTELNAEE